MPSNLLIIGRGEIEAEPRTLNANAACQLVREVQRGFAPRERRLSTRKGDRVTFRIADAFLPDAEALRATFSESSELEGTVVDFSDSGEASRVFALVEVIQRHTVVLPVDKLRFVGEV